MTKNRSFTYGACLAIIVSIAVWGAIGRGGADAADLYGWVEWLVLEGPAPAVALDLVVAHRLSPQSSTTATSPRVMAETLSGHRGVD